MAKIHVSDDELLLEPCLSCEKVYIESTEHKFKCDEEKCIKENNDE